jgi:hypothetical protein
LLVIMLLAVARAPLGIELAGSSRYVYIGSALILPLSLIGISDLAGRRVIAILLVAAVAAPWAVLNGRELVQKASLQADRERLIREQIVAAGTVFSGSDLLRDRPEPVYSPDLDLRELDLLLPGFPGGVHPSREALIRAALALQTSVTPVARFHTSVPASRLRAFHTALHPRPDGCTDATPAGANPRFLLPAGTPSSLEVIPSEPLELELLLSEGGIRPDYIERPVIDPSRTWFINTAVDEGIVGRSDLIVRFAGALTICPVDAAAGER